MSKQKYLVERLEENGFQPDYKDENVVQFVFNNENVFGSIVLDAERYNVIYNFSSATNMIYEVTKNICIVDFNEVYVFNKIIEDYEDVLEWSESSNMEEDYV